MEFRHISHISVAITDKRMKIDPHCQRRNCSPIMYMCVVPRTQSQIGNRSFSVAGPRLWNNLLTEILKRDITFEHYRRLLKAFLFVYAAAHCDFYLSAPDVSTLTHSLTLIYRSRMLDSLPNNCSCCDIARIATTPWSRYS